MRNLLIFIFILFFCISCSTKSKNNQSSYSLSNALNAPVEFANGQIETTNGISFSNDGRELYISLPIERRFTNERAFAGIFVCKFHEGKWSSPERVEFESNIDAYHPVLSYDNQVLFFNSRSHTDTVNRSIPHNIWFVKKTNKGWSKPEMVIGVNGPYYDSYPTIAKNKNLYFNSDRPGGKGGMDIYVSKYIHNTYQIPVNIQAINSENSENDLVVDPDEKFIIFNRYIDSTRELDLYISHKHGNNWKKPIPLDILNHQDEWELTPSLSPDGKYFFYELNGKIMQFELGKLLQSN